MSILKKIFIFSLFLYLNIGNYSYGQYIETFSIPDKGILLGPCSGGTSASCVSTDFTGVDWNINGNFTGFDATFGAEDYIKTIAEVLEFGGDIDEELCWESPVLDISAAGGTVSASVDIVWTGHDALDYVDVEYQVDSGSWLQIPNAFGAGTHTIDFAGSSNTGSATIYQTGLNGGTLSIRVCVDTNTSAENTTIDNVTVPEADVVLSVDDEILAKLIRIYPNPTSESLSIQITPELLNESYKIYDVLGKTMLEGTLSSDQTNIKVSDLSNGIYFISLGDKKTSKFIKQ